MPNIVIIGANFAGASAAKILFKEISAATDKSKYNVKVISSTEKVYFNPSAPRLLVEPDSIDKAFFSAENYIKKYAKGVDFKFIHGTVQHSDFEAKTLTVSGGAGGEIIGIGYDYLIIASGSISQSPAFKIDGDYANSVKAIKEFSKCASNPETKTIAILGGGATGVETAGELAAVFPGKKITLYTGASGPLSTIGKSPQATKKLENAGIKIINNIRYISLDKETNTVHFDDGTSANYDLYIPADGVAPNSHFVDVRYLDDLGYIKVDKYFRIQNHPDVIVTGDVASITSNSMADVQFAQAKPLAATIKKQIFKRGSLIPYTPLRISIIVPIARTGGIGILFGIPIPSFLVKILKGKDFSLGFAKKEYL